MERGGKNGCGRAKNSRRKRRTNGGNFSLLPFQNKVFLKMRSGKGKGKRKEERKKEEIAFIRHHYHAS